MSWPRSTDELVAEQELLASAAPSPWHPGTRSVSIGGCFICFPRGQAGAGTTGDPAWAGAAVVAAEGRVVSATVTGFAGAPYAAGMLALREGPLLEAVVLSLPNPPDVLLVNSTGRDHPRSAGLALHLGAILDLPTVGVTHRPLLGVGEWPQARRGAHSRLLLAGRCVGYWVCTRSGARPLAVHAGWRTDPGTALAVVIAASSEKARTPEAIRQARRVARKARAASAASSTTLGSGGG